MKLQKRARKPPIFSGGMHGPPDWQTPPDCARLLLGETAQLAGVLAPPKPPNGCREPGAVCTGPAGNREGATGGVRGPTLPVDGPPETALGLRPRTVRRLHPTGESSCGGADQHLPDLSGGVRGPTLPVDGPPETALGLRPRTVRRLHPTGESRCGGADQNLPDLSGGVSESDIRYEQRPRKGRSTIPGVSARGQFGKKSLTR